MKKKVAALVLAADDPTVETTNVEIGGKVYRMCFDLRSLRKAERELNLAGHEVSILFEFPRRTFESTCIMFAASIRRFHPEITYDAAFDALIDDFSASYRVGHAVSEAWMKAMAIPDKENAAGEKNPI